MHPYYRAILDAYASARRPLFHQLSPDAAKTMMRATIAAIPPPTGLPDLALVVDAAIAGPHGKIPIRRYVPHGEVLGTCVYFHAGGWVIGDLDLSDATCRRLAGAARCEIVSVDYRLAPEHPYPAPLDDAFAALEWAGRERPGPLVVMGESAGGNLAAACAIRARDRGGPVLAGQFLAYPVTDCNFETGSYRDLGGNNWLLSTADMRWFWDHYCPPGVDRANPLISPLQLADAAGLPPALIYVGQLDPLRDEGLAYARRLAEAGVSVSTHCEAGVLHGYLSAAGAIPQVAQAVARAASWIRHQVAITATNHER